MTLYRDYQPGLYPTALRDPYGLSWGRAMGTMKDRVVTLAIDAVDAGLVLRCPDDALPLLGADVQLERFPTEPADLYRTRIAGAWETWKWAGTRTALLTVAAQLGLSDAVLLTAREWNLTDATTLWARWFLVIPSTATPLTEPDLPWDGTGKWDDGGVWDDASNTPDDVAFARRSARLFSNARDAGVIRHTLGSTDYYDDPGGVWDGGAAIPENAADDTWVDDPAFIDWRV